MISQGVSTNPLADAYSKVSSVSNILFAGILLGLSVGLLASAIVAIVVAGTIALVVVVVCSAAMIILVYLLFIKRQLSLQFIQKTVATALVIDQTNKAIVPPIKLRMQPRLGADSRPFAILSGDIFPKVSRITEIKGTDLVNATTILTLLSAFLSKVNMMDQFASTDSHAERGPFMSARSGPARPYKEWQLEDTTDSIIDTSIMRSIFPASKIMLPQGVSLSLDLTRHVSPTFQLKSPIVSLKMSTSMGVGNPRELTSWNRGFSSSSKETYIAGVAYVVTLQFGGFGLLGLNRDTKPSEWSVQLYLQWFYNVYDWLGSYLDWLDSDLEIPIEETFILVEADPPHYRYSLGPIPPGNGHIVFER